MRICVLNASYEQSKSDFRGHDPYCDPSRHLPEHTFERHLIEKATAVRQVRDLAAKGFDAFVNLCDGAWDEDRAGIEVVQALERFIVQFLSRVRGVGNIRSSFALKQVKYQTALPLPERRPAADGHNKSTRPVAKRRQR